MRNLIFIVSFCSCVIGTFYYMPVSRTSYSRGNPTTQLHYENKKSLTVSVTFYTPEEGKWGYAKSTGGKLTPHHSAAVDPKIIPYGTKIDLPKFVELTAEDTGSAVKDKKASRLRAAKMLQEHKISPQEYDVLKNAPVIDIFVDNKDEYEHLCKTTPNFMTATLR